MPWKSFWLLHPNHVSFIPTHVHSPSWFPLIYIISMGLLLSPHDDSMNFPIRSFLYKDIFDSWWWFKGFPSLDVWWNDNSKCPFEMLFSYLMVLLTTPNSSSSHSLTLLIFPQLSFFFLLLLFSLLQAQISTLWLISSWNGFRAFERKTLSLFLDLMTRHIAKLEMASIFEL